MAGQVVKIGIPSKGRLQSATLEWFAARGLGIETQGADRSYSARATGIANVEPVLLSASEIPRELRAGRIGLGVTGSDLVYERFGLRQDVVTDVAGLGFGHADLVIAVPRFWVDVETLHDLDEVASAFRARHGIRLRIATKYHRLVREHLGAFGLADYQLVDSQGATEGTIRNQTAEAIADITSTGATLTANGLKVLSEPPIHRSQARLWQSNALTEAETASVARVLAELGVAAR